MTGFGAGVAEHDGWRVGVELRSVNHRGLDLRFRVAGRSAKLQGAMAAKIRAVVERGHIDVSVDVVRLAGVAAAIGVDAALAKGYDRALRSLAAALGRDELPPLALILAQPGVLTAPRDDDDDPAIAAAVDAALDAALAELQRARDAEGARLAADVSARLAALAALHDEIAQLAAGAADAARQRLRQRVADLVGDVAVDVGRLEAELVLLADRSDVTEELVRFAAHLQACVTALAEEAAGRRLSFLVQELLREINTIGSKCAQLAITERVVSAKVEVEKMREQVVNLA